MNEKQIDPSITIANARGVMSDIQIKQMAVLFAAMNHRGIGDHREIVASPMQKGLAALAEIIERSGNDPQVIQPAIFAFRLEWAILPPESNNRLAVQ